MKVYCLQHHHVVSSACHSVCPNKCYSLSCNFPILYVNGRPESKIFLKYPHSQLLIQTSQFYMGIWHKSLKSKHYYFFHITFPRMKIWRWRCSRYLHNHVLHLCEKCQCLKFRYIEFIHKKHFLSFLKMHNCVSYLYLHKLTFLWVPVSNNFTSFLFEKQYALV